MSLETPQPSQELELYDQGYVDQVYLSQPNTSFENRMARFYMGMVEVQDGDRIDSKTGAYTQETFMKYAEKMFTEAKNAEGSDRAVEKAKQTLGIVVLDLDNFKLFNDTYGHPAGDEVLSVFGDILRKAVRDNDIIGRSSEAGDEFFIALEGVDEEKMSLVLGRLRENFAESALGGNDIGLDYTAAGSLLTEHGMSTVGEMVTAADERLITAKRKGEKGQDVLPIQVTYNKPHAIQN